MQEITIQELTQLRKDNQTIHLVDVREAYEHEDFNIGGQLIPLGEVIQRAAEIPTTEPVVLYCRKGIRSAIAIQRLEEKFGWTNLVNLQGGIEGLRMDE